MHRVLFVCTGNTCRSPLAEGLLRTLAKEAGVRVDVKSAGVAAAPGSPMSAHSASILRKKGFVEPIASKSLGPELAQWADLILTMTVGHKRAVIQQFPEAVEKTYALKEFTEDDADTLAAVRAHGELFAELQMKYALGQAIAPEERAKLRKLEERLPFHDIADPFGGPLAAYEQAAAEIEASLRKLLGKLEH